MTKKKYPFVRQDNSSLEARDYSYHREERDAAKGLFGQKITFMKRKAKYNMEANSLIWWLKVKHFLKAIFLGTSRKAPEKVITTLRQEVPPPRYKKDEAGWVSPRYAISKRVEFDGKAVADNRCVGALKGSCEIDAYKVVRTQISQLTKEDGKNTIMVTSARPGEGKTLTAINLALSFAKEYDQTVLLVDCDLKQQSIHKVLGIESRKGLVNYLADGTDLSQLIMWPGIEKFTLLSGGRSLFDSSELLGSPRMKELVSEMRDRYTDRYVIFDVPSVLVGADAITFAPLVDGIIIVVETGKTGIDDVKKVISLLPKEKILGFVLNKSGS